MITIDRKLMDELSARAAESPRRRSHFNLHKSLEEDIHRLLMAAQRDSYFRPHRHDGAGKSELMLCLRGSASLLVFRPDGEVAARYELVPGGGTVGYELEEGTFHCMVINTPDTVMIEIKHGPYIPTPEADFGAWAPPESSPEAAEFLDWLREASPGDHAARR
ncbi:MAG: WbuC family cupin fold metalloprotein [Victivallales bacterium]|nr:WbuC family cupin fold metalloprotein [Victivallales bacterium]